jgi:hypothetical protein
VPLGDDTFGAWVLWANYAAGQYAKCRAASLAGGRGDLDGGRLDH